MFSHSNNLSQYLADSAQIAIAMNQVPHLTQAHQSLQQQIKASCQEFHMKNAETGKKILVFQTGPNPKDASYIL